MSATNHYLSRMTWKEVSDLDLTTGALVLPIGAIEQHGPHLTADTDLVIAESMLDMALDQVDPSLNVYRLPALPFSRSIEHHLFPGTMALSTTTLIGVLMDIAESVKKSGFRRLVFWNGHGGNQALLEVICRDVRIKTGLMVFQVAATAGANDCIEPPQERELKYGIHAGDSETSILLAVAPDRVRQDKVVCEYPDMKSEFIELENAPATIGWTTDDFEKTGTWGDATKATAERGQARVDFLMKRLPGMLSEIATFEYGSK